MTNKNTPMARRIYRIVLSVSILLSGLCLILGCIHIFLNGNGYSRDVVANVFSKINIPIYLCLSFIIGDIVWEFISPINQCPPKLNKKTKTPQKQASKSKRHFTIKFIVLIIAIAALVVGFIFGGYADVLTKAINICTECIGLG